MNDDERTALDAWADKLRQALELNDLEFDIDRVLDLAGDAARSVVRPAAPVTTFLVGYAAGRAAAGGSDPATAVSDAIVTATGLAAAE
ncbi:hypothetical protein BKA04_001739 [Cryobacterium mesophilum]|uniref:Molybdopterin-guanine dinucleotide biosynthesis protein n=1 Tax=Terrimesophilobacter mesophilus TaxID=433647 RepID=A0A4R8VDK5_9MICO|nr:DUF6457 domain-containing protein [Terrimesophilobacter mesophilus]MBB5633516.1 hypothetical protein [Terrimesophilobacter mesophilus]TFB80222.1 molybdopterin-guanine dinucleotide biosynthesis protein [Terrimesophilobacter mesophilus]